LNKWADQLQFKISWTYPALAPGQKTIVANQESRSFSPSGVGAIDWYAAGMQHVAADTLWLEPALAERLAGMPYTKRREEARLGRWTAKCTIARTLGLELSPDILRDICIVNAPDGAPEARIKNRPLDRVIAMTDRADWAVCATASGPYRIGCDLELVEPRSDAFVRDYFTLSERALVDAASEPDAIANLIWSAKESALKVMRTGLRRDTRSVEVKLSVTDSTGWQPLRVTADEGVCFYGWWIRFGQFLLTVASELDVPPPRSLEHPSPLQFAEPAHSWMDNPLTPHLDVDNCCNLSSSDTNNN
jgi:4'-phosphopantetheinyl transferase